MARINIVLALEHFIILKDFFSNSFTTRPGQRA